MKWINDHEWYGDKEWEELVEICFMVLSQIFLEILKRTITKSGQLVIQTRLK
jgi:hypothetical protein